MGYYLIKNLIQAEEYLLQLTKILEKEIKLAEEAKQDVSLEQDEAQKQGILVKKMTNYMSEELGKIENSNLKNKNSNREKSISKNLTKLTETEKKLRTLRDRLGEFVDGNDKNSLEEVNSSISNDLKKFDMFMLDLVNLLNEKIANLEKIVIRLQAEKKESQQQKFLLQDMTNLFNDEITDLEKTIKIFQAQKA